MHRTLLDQFLKEECTPYVRNLLQEALRGHVAPSEKFEFNRFEITIDRRQCMVLIEDILDVTETGAESVQLNDFAKALDR